MTRDEALKKYPLLVAHMMCESLGYFSPLSAANALAAYANNETFACEWYSHMCMCRGKDLFDNKELLKVGREVVELALINRHRHKGYMSDFDYAKKLVRKELEDQGSTSGMLAGWF